MLGSSISLWAPSDGSSIGVTGGSIEASSEKIRPSISMGRGLIVARAETSLLYQRVTSSKDCRSRRRSEYAPARPREGLLNALIANKVRLSFKYGLSDCPNSATFLRETMSKYCVCVVHRRLHGPQRSSRGCRAFTKSRIHSRGTT